METKCPYRPELTTLPHRIASLKVSDDGYRVPWFVAWIDGKPEFRAADPQKLVEAIRFRKCWVCGEPLGARVTFPIGPMCCINRTSAEPPSHHECAVWSAINCPFLNGRKSKRREDEKLDAIGVAPAGLMIKRQPGVVALWNCREFRLFSDGSGGVLFRPGDPVDGVEWYAHGRIATRAEVEESVRTGMPILNDAARQDGDEAVGMLGECVRQFEKLLPAA